MSDKKQETMRSVAVTMYSDEVSNRPRVECSSAEDFSRTEKMILLAITGPQERLPYSTRRVMLSIGVEVEMYEIPSADRARVFEMMYPFAPMPSLDETVYDLHEGKYFQVGEYEVLREGESNFLVSPYYAESGGTVLDWVTNYDDGKERQVTKFQVRDDGD
ncbi:MAG: hypothetical protein GX561_14875 [Lentisphaerae bacterium]|jgi:hypothetical protein|nr:hypothetical protein [Lentisphaerota bacterium]